MATRTETQFGSAKDLGTSYVSLGTVGGSTTLNLLLNAANLLNATVKLRVYVAANSWTTGEPTGSDLVARIAYDIALAPNDVIQISGIVLTTGQKLIVRADTATSLDVIASGVSIV